MICRKRHKHDIRARVSAISHLLYISSMYQIIYANRTLIHQKIECVSLCNNTLTKSLKKHNHFFAERLMHTLETHAKNLGINTIHEYRVTTSLTLSVSTKLGHNMRTSSPSLHRPQTSVCFFFLAKLLDTHSRHPRDRGFC